MNKPKMHKGAKKGYSSDALDEEELKKGAKKGYSSDALDEEELKKGTKKADEDGEYEGDEDEDEGDEDEGMMDKALIAADDLEKGLAELERIGKRTPGRKAELLGKASRGKLTRSESAELARLTSGEGSISKALEDDEIEKAVDVSPALDKLATAVGEIGDALDSKLEKSLEDQGHFNAALAKAVMAIGEVLRAQNDALVEFSGKIEKALDAPVRAPRAVQARAERAPQSDEPASGDGIGQVTAMKALGAAFDKALADGDRTTLGVLRDDMARVQAGGTPSSFGARQILEFAKSYSGKKS